MAIGTPLIIDTATKNRLFRHPTRILVDVDFSHRIFDENLVERDDFAFNLEVAYIWLDFYMYCQNIGHVTALCWLIPEKDDLKVRKTQEGGVELCSQKLFRSLR